MLRTLSLIVVIVNLLFMGCGAPARQVGTTSSFKSKPAWIDSHPSSSTYFIGVGQALMTTNATEAQKQARRDALSDIAEQIKMTITSDVMSGRKYVTENKKVVEDKRVSQKLIEVFTQAVLQDYEEQATWNGPDGYCYSKVVLEKKKYYDRVNKKINDAIAIAVDAIVASEQGLFDARLRELYKGMIALDDFLGNAMTATISGRDVILNNELPRRLQQLLSTVQINPVLNTLKLAATAPIPDTLGARVFIDGKQDQSIALSWTTSVSGVDAIAMPVRSDGLYPVLIKSLSASAGLVQVTATIDCGQLIYNLLQRGFSLPHSSFTLSRSPPRIYSNEINYFNKKLLEQLTSSAATIAESSIDDADYVLSSQCTLAGEPAQAMGLYRAKVMLSLVLTTAKGISILNVHEEVSAADAQSGSRAQANAEKVALDKAMKRINGAF
jgi:hypothetical protein